MPSYSHHSTSIPITSTSTTALPSFPQMTMQSDRVYAHNQFEANVSDCLCCLQTVPEEQLGGTAAFPIVVEDPEAEDNIFSGIIIGLLTKAEIRLYEVHPAQ